MAFVLVGSASAPISNTLTSNYVWYSKFTAIASGRLTEYRVTCDASMNVKVAIYSDNAGSPGSRLAYNDSSQAVISGINTLTISSINIASGTVYWVAIIADASYNVGRYATTGGIGRFKYAIYTTFSWPATAGTGFTSSESIVVISGWGLAVTPPSAQSIIIG